MDIEALTQAGVARAWKLIASVLTSTTLKDNPTTTHNTSTGKDEVTSWGVSLPVTAFFYDDIKTERPVPGGGVKAPPLRKAIINRLQTPDLSEITTNAVIAEGSTTWRIREVATPPGDGIFILSLNK